MIDNCVFDNPVGVVDLEELDRISKVSGSGDGGAEPQSTPVIATILVTVISFEATVTAFSTTVEC